MTASTTHLPVFSHAEQAGWEGFSHGNHWFQIGVVSVVVRGWGGRGVERCNGEGSKCLQHVVRE